MSKLLEALMKKAQKDHGKGSFTFADESRENTIPRLSTGILMLDYACGGGIPMGRMTEIYGKKSSGKSSLIAKVAVRAQRTCKKCLSPVVGDVEETEYKVKVPDPKLGVLVEETRRKTRFVPTDCVNKCRVVLADDDGESKKKEKIWPGPMVVLWVDAERTFDPAFYEKFGLDCKKVHLITAPDGDIAVDLVDASLRTGDVGLVVIDSIAHLTPSAEREKLSGEIMIAGQAKLMARALRQWTASMGELKANGKNEAAIVLANQTRMKIGLFPVEIKPGGMAQDFDSSLDIRLFQDQPKPFVFDSTGRVLWQYTRFAIEKSKVGGPKMEGRYRMCLLDHPGRTQGDTWDDEVVADMAVEYKFFVKDPNTKGAFLCLGQPFESEEALRERMKSKDDFFWALRNSIIELLVGMPSDGRLAEKKSKESEDAK